jgi:hypothetical protein
MTFITLFVCLFVAIEIYREFTYQEKWKTVKTISHSFFYSSLATLFLMCI